MKPIISLYQKKMLAAVALTATAAISFSGSASAAVVGTTENTKILNVVHVTYNDASTTQSFEATASTVVTVSLVKAALAVTAPPSGDAAPATFSCPPAYSVDSGGTVSYLYALTAAANGDDLYSFALPATTDTYVVTPASLNYYLLNAAGTVVATNPANYTFGAATPVGYKGTANAAEKATLLFPGGALAGFADGDMVVVNQTTGGKRVYLVDGAPVVGTAATHTPGTKVNANPATWSDGTETKGELKLKAFPASASIDLGAAGTTTYSGSTTLPDFSTNAFVTGEPVGEMFIVKVTAQATVNVWGANGTVGYSVNTTASGGTNPASIPGLVCPAGNFLGVGLSIAKGVRNFTQAPAGSFTATATGLPGEILQYQLTVTNNKGKATSAAIADAVPQYTTLVISSGNFATITTTDGTVTVSTAVDAETQPVAGAGNETGFGNITGTGVANDALKFFVGKGSGQATGGTVANGETYTIQYKVKID